MTALDIPSHALKEYRPLEAIRQRSAAIRVDISNRRRRALLTASKAARLLRDEFTASEVFMFGSLARYKGFTLWSDIDLAARGIPPERFFEAVGVVTGLSAEFKIDLIELESCPEALHERIVTEGKAL